MNPFLINAYISPGFFCDREEETKALLSNIKNQSNTAFFAQRRLGKTALVQHAFYLLRKKKQTCIYIDIYATQNLKDLSNALANSIYQVFPQKHSIGQRFWETIKLLRPVITVDELSGNPELTLDINQPKQFEKTIAQLLQFLDQQNKTVVIAIDEFQQILEYPEKNVEALLRTTIQQLKHVHFIFCGSNQKMMQAIFNSAKRPFYSSTKNINLQKIGTPKYAGFIKHHFTVNKKTIVPNAIELILRLTSGHTYYTQRLCHEIFSTDHKNIHEQEVLRALNDIILENEGIYFQYRNLLTSSQWNLLKAIALEEQLEKPYAQDFLYTYRLGGAAGVRRSIESLIEKEMVFYHTTSAEAYYEVQDKFLMHWLRNK